MSNLWLNPDLVMKPDVPDQHRKTLLAEIEDTPNGDFEARLDDYALLRRAHRADGRRFLIQALSIVLLVASAAFSYLAWSDALPSRDTAAEELGRSDGASGDDSAVAFGVQGDHPPAPGSASQRERVLALRAENQQLRERLNRIADKLGKRTAQAHAERQGYSEDNQAIASDPAQASASSISFR